tara:strand:+ start:41 stop:1060 length:1020 start_codon:yes stop_codon:yes gene_type:complete
MKAKLISQADHERVPLHQAIPLITPFVVYIEPSGYCNLKCEFCPHGSQSGRDGLKMDIMPLELGKKLIDDIAVFPDKIKLLRVCGTGEPLTNKNIVELLEYANKMEIAEKIEMVTNGIKLTPELSRQLPRFANRIIISIEGLSSEEYKRVTRINVNLEKLIDNLKIIYNHRGTCTLAIKTVGHVTQSESKQKKFFDMFGNICDEIYIEQLVPMWPDLDSEYELKSRWGDDQVINKRVCPQIFKGLQVQADGEVVPCCVDWKRVNVIGNITTESFKDVWNGTQLSEFRKAHLKGEKDKIDPCKDCTMNDSCEYDDIDPYIEECMKQLGILDEVTDVKDIL